MNAIDDSVHYEKTSDEPPPSLLVVVLDTNPSAWALLSKDLTLSEAVASLLVFINAHLAFNNANKVAVIASHVQRAEFLYPVSPQHERLEVLNGDTHANDEENDNDIEMTDGPGNRATDDRSTDTDYANFYRPFSQVHSALHGSLTKLIDETTISALAAPPTTSLAGALTLALTYINKQTIFLSPDLTTGNSNNATSNPSTSLSSRILILSVSTASPNQYIPLMNTIFASQRLSIPIDVCALSASSSSFLQQASDATSGTYLSLATTQGSAPLAENRANPLHGLLQTLLQAFLPTPPSRGLLIPPTQISVDFRAACFCHRRVIDIGFVCSICLSIFCEPPDRAICLTCGTHLRLGNYGRKPAVLPKKKKKRRRAELDGVSISNNA